MSSNQAKNLEGFTNNVIYRSCLREITCDGDTKIQVFFHQFEGGIINYILELGNFPFIGNNH